MKQLVALFISALLFVSCSKKSESDYLKSAEENLNSNKFEEAVADLENFINDYPKSEKAPETLTKLAALYQNKSLKNLSEKESLEKAAKIYRQIFDDYPSSTKAPTSLFMSAFILANDLKQYHRAEMSYRLFLQKFPEHELADDAQIELDNLGLSPDEILKKRAAKNI